MFKQDFEGVKLDFLKIQGYMVRHGMRYLACLRGKKAIYFINKGYISTTMHLTAIPREPVNLSVSEFNCFKSYTRLSV